MNICTHSGLWFLLATATFSFCLFLLNLLGLPLNQTSFFALLLFFLLVYWFLKTIRIRVPTIPSHEWSKSDKAMLFVVLLALVVVLVAGSWNVVTTWDALTLYDFRALRLLETGSLSQVAQIQGNYFYSYPLHTSLMHASFYWLGFKSPMLYYALLFTAFISVFYGLLRRIVARSFALFATLLVILAPHLFWHAQIAYTNLPYSIYLGLGAIFILQYIGFGRRSDAILGAVLTGFSVWMRSVEPFWLINIIVLAGATLARRRYLDLLYSLLITLPLERVWKVYASLSRERPTTTALTQLTSSLSTISSSSSTLVVLPSVITYFLTHAVRPYAPILALLLLTVLYKLSTRSRDWIGEFMIAGYYALSFYGTFVFALTQPYWDQIPGSLERMVMFVSVPLIYLFAKTAAKIYD